MTLLRTESFVPLTAAPASTERREFRVAVINRDTQEEKKFHSLEPSRPAPVATAAATALSAENKTCEPRVTVQRDGNRVTHLRVHCSCGQVLDLACVYDEPPPTA